MSANGDSYRSPNRGTPWTYEEVYNEPHSQTVVKKRDIQEIGEFIDNWKPSDGKATLKAAILEQLTANPVVNPTSHEYL